MGSALQSGVCDQDVALDSFNAALSNKTALKCRIKPSSIWHSLGRRKRRDVIPTPRLEAWRTGGMFMAAARSVRPKVRRGRIGPVGCRSRRRCSSGDGLGRR